MRDSKLDFSYFAYQGVKNLFFIRVGAIMAWAMVIWGILRSAIGFYVASIEGEEQRIFAAKRYLGSSSSREAIDNGVIMIAAGVVIGLLVTIAKNEDSH